MDRKNTGASTGATQIPGLRVSVGTLVRVLFRHPDSRSQFLALERTATLLESREGKEVIVRAKPFGGGVRILREDLLRERIGDFRYDSERSSQEQDFRVMINAGAWEKVKELCMAQYKTEGEEIIETSPERELSEEIYDSLKISLTKEDYLLKPQGVIFRDLPVITENIHAAGAPTARVYFLFEAQIITPKIIQWMLNNSLSVSDRDLQEMAYADAANGGKGRANALLALDLEEVQKAYNLLPGERKDIPFYIGDHRLEGNVPMIL